MPWTVMIQLDADSPNVGSATAIWNVGLPEEFTYSARVRATATDGKAFATAAVAARKLRDSRTVVITALTAQLTAMLATAEATG